MFVVPNIVVNDIRNIRGKNTSDCELDVFSTDIGEVIRFKYLEHKIMVQNYVFLVHYYLNDNRWIRWTITRQRSHKDEVSLKYVDDNSTALPKNHPKNWYKQLINAYANTETYQVSQSFKCSPIVMEDSTRRRE